MISKIPKILLVLLSGILYIPFGFAESNISISPTRDDITLDPGSFSTGEILLYNGGNEDKTFQLHFEECIKTQDVTNCGVYLSGGTIEDSFLFWMNIPNGDQQITVPANNSMKIQYQITLPKSAKGGTYMGVIKVKEIVGTENINSKRPIEVGAIFLLTVNAGIRGVLDIGEISTTISTGFSSSYLLYSIFSYFNPFSTNSPIEDDKDFHVKFSIPMKNTGNVFIKPIGKIELFDNGKMLEKIGFVYDVNDNIISGKKIVNYLPVNEDGKIILPNNEMILSSDWQGFIYHTVDQNGEIVVHYHSPGKYFSNRLLQQYSPWFYKTIQIERTKQLTAKVYIEDNYPDSGKDFIQEIPFSVRYVGVKSVPNEALLFWFHMIIQVW